MRDEIAAHSSLFPKKKYKLKARNFQDFTGDPVVKTSPSNAGDMGSIAGSGRSTGEENGSALQYSCQGNPMDTGAWRAAVHWGKKE